MTQTQLAIIKEVYVALEKLGAPPALLGAVGSWQDTVSDEDVLELLRDWNAGRPMLDEVYASTGKTKPN